MKTHVKKRGLVDDADDDRTTGHRALVMINMKTAKSLGRVVLQSMRTLRDELIA